MKMVRLAVVMVMLASVLAFVGCVTTETKTSTVAAALCAKCGQIKGTDVCCKADMPKCEKCKLAKGAPGCCKLPKDATAPVPLCGKCGEIKGAAECCKPAAKCTKCGLHKGAPGCCKLVK